MSLREGVLSRGSSVSAVSGAASSGGNSTGGGEPLVNVDELTDEQILSLVNETAITVDRLQLETMMFERYFEKLGGGGGGEGGSVSGGGHQERRESGATASSTPDSSQPPTASGSLLDVSPAQGLNKKFDSKF